MRSPVSFCVSGLIHGSLLAWIALGPPPAAKPSRPSMYDQEILPYEKHLVWYHLRDRLPDVSPDAVDRAAQPRARVKFDQAVVAGERDDPKRPPQMIWMPEAAVPAPKPLPLPNVLAVAPPKPVRPFAPPPVRDRDVTQAALPTPPPAAMPAPAIPRAPAKPWAPPSQATVRSTVREIAEAPAVPMPTRGQANRALALRVWTPPADAAVRSESKEIPVAPAAAIPATSATAPFLATASSRRLVRPWGPPAAAVAVRSETKETPDAPTAAIPAIPTTAPFLATASSRQLVRPWNPPAVAKPAAHAVTSPLPEAPVVSAAATAPVSLAIAGLNPSRATDFAPPTASRAAGFSAGPEPRPDGAADSGPAMLVVPGLLARGGAKDNQPTLVAGIPPLRRDLLAGVRPPPGAPNAAVPEAPRAARVASAPDPRLEGRLVYSMAIQMPNITSYYGSWLVWFAERDQTAGNRPAVDVRPPVPIRKVDPKYIASAVSERVEGVVRLFAVIRKDGRVDSVAILRRLDDRLDQSAVEALAKWQFEPAMSNGSAVDVDAVFEIPFRLAPRAAR